MVAQTLESYDVDVAGLSEITLAGEGSLTEVDQAYTLFWKGVSEGQPRCTTTKGASLKGVSRMVASARLTAEEVARACVCSPVNVHQRQCVTLITVSCMMEEMRKKEEQ